MSFGQNPSDFDKIPRQLYCALFRRDTPLKDLYPHVKWIPWYVLPLSNSISLPSDIQDHPGRFQFSISA